MESAVAPDHETGVDLDPRGLDPAEAARRLVDDGPNLLPTAAVPPWWHSLIAQFTHFFAVMLWVAAGLALVAGLVEISVAIVGVVFANSLFSFIQERRAEHAAEGLRRLLPLRVTVRRRGPPVLIEAADLVRGDIVLVEAGDKVCADLTVIDGHGVAVDDAALTGESALRHVDDGEPLWAGTFVAEGVAVAVVTAAGTRTRLAEIATLTTSVARPPTPLARELNRLVRTIAIVAISVGAGFFALTFLVDTPPSEGIVFAIGITVALVPEGMLPTTTLSLAVGARRMAERQALVRRLESVETLGSASFICTDKTGTLTAGHMGVVQVWTPVGGLRLAPSGFEPVPADLGDLPTASATAVRRLAELVAGCAGGAVVEGPDGWEPHGDPQEVALHVLALRLGVPDDHDATADRRFAFDPHRRRMSVVRGNRVVVKGASDSVLPLCTGSDVDIDHARRVAEKMAADGLRVLAVADRVVPTPADVSTVADAETELSLVGLVGLVDPPRHGVADAVAACRRAGIAVAMVTGDHPLTASSVARDIGLSLPVAPVFVGADLPDDDAELEAFVDRDGFVAARITPPDKLRIAAALRRRGHVVAMTGDGVNDGPALREADIGVAMGLSGTDVARDAADLVLLDDDFATIVDAVAEGRGTYTNIRRFLTYHLSDNVAELTPFAVWALSGGRIPLAISVLAVLVLDLVTDTLPAVALGAERPPASVLHQPPLRGALLDRPTAWRAFGLFGPLEALGAMATFLATLTLGGWRFGDIDPPLEVLAPAAGAAFAAVVCGQAANAFACRKIDGHTRTPRNPGDGRDVARRPNRLLWGAVVVSLGLGAVAVGVPPVSTTLGHAWLTWAGVAGALATAGVVWLAGVVVGGGFRTFGGRRYGAVRGAPHQRGRDVAPDRRRTRPPYAATSAPGVD